MFNSHRYTFEFSRAQQTYPVATFMGLLCFGLFFICLMFVWVDFNQAKEASIILQAKSQKKESLKAKVYLKNKPKPVPQNTVPKVLLNDIANIKKQLNLQWFDLLGAFETAQTEDIALTQLLPDADKSTFSMTGEAKDYAMLLKYIHRLEETDCLFNVHLKSHEVNETHPQHPFVFEIEGEWKI